jgi:hypothetical protein
MTLVDKPGTDTSGKQPYQSGLLARIIAIHFPRKIVVAEQGLLATTSAAIALDTGESFSGMNSGATGRLRNTKPFTVLSSGVVVYGQPREGDPCFMACVDGTTILRGHQDIGGSMEGIVWDPVYSVPIIDSSYGLCALSFAGGGFFVVRQTSKTSSSCAVSFNGTDFSEIGNLYSGVSIASPDRDSQTPGSVAYNGREYATAGINDSSPGYPGIIAAADFGMMWSSSADGSSWSSGYTTPVETADPGTNAVPLNLAPGAQAYTTVAGGAGRFVAAATSRSIFPSAEFEGVTFSYSTAAAAVSSDGSSWTTAKLPGAIEANRVEGVETNVASSYGVSVAFVKTGSNTGYFVISAGGSISAAPDFTEASWCWKGDGQSWQMVKQAGDASFGTVSAVAKDLSATKIVTV